MNKNLFAALMIGLFMLGTASMARATLLVYHDKASFLAHAGTTTLHDFESDAAGDIDPGSARNFGDFSIYASNTGIYQAEVRQQTGNKDVYMNSSNNSASLDVIFHNDITAFGFDYVAEGNQSWDLSLFKLLGNTWDLGTPGDSGFFGVIETGGSFAAGTPFSFGQQSSNWSGVSFDNVIYSSSRPDPVPEPASLLLLGTGLASLFGIRHKKQ